MSYLNTSRYRGRSVVVLIDNDQDHGIVLRVLSGALGSNPVIEYSSAGDKDAPRHVGKDYQESLRYFKKKLSDMQIMVESLFFEKALDSFKASETNFIEQKPIFAVLMSPPTFPGTAEEQEVHYARLKKLLEEDVVAIHDIHDDFEKTKYREYDGQRHHNREKIVPIDLHPVFEFNETEGMEIENFVRNVLADAGTFTLLFIEPNVNYTEAQRAWYCSGVDFKMFRGAPALRKDSKLRHINNPRCHLTLQVALRSSDAWAKSAANEILKQCDGDPIKMKKPIKLN